jgi:hypothetical protein
MSTTSETEARSPRWSSASGKVILRHFLLIVAEQPDNTPIGMALQLEGINTIFQLLHLSDEVINTLSYPSAADHNRNIPLRKGDKGILTTLIAYIRHLLEIKDFDLNEQYGEIQAEDFNEFRVNTPITPPTPVAAQLMTPPFRSPQPIMPSPQVAKPTAADYFRRNI